MPVYEKPSQYKGAFSHLVPGHIRKAIREYRATLKAYKAKGYSYGDVLDMVPKELRQFMLKMHQIQTIIWMVDNDRMTAEQFYTTFKEVSPLASILD